MVILESIQLPPEGEAFRATSTGRSQITVSTCVNTIGKAYTVAWRGTVISQVLVSLKK